MTRLKNDPAYVQTVITLLRRHYPTAKIILNFSNPWELLVAVMLSAQCTDVMVNKVTTRLFQKYKTIQEYAHADLHHLEQAIHSTGFYRNKAKHLKATAQIVLKRFHGKVPATMEELTQLPGIGRKTANCPSAFKFPHFLKE